MVLSRSIANLKNYWVLCHWAPTCCQNILSRFLYRLHQITTVEDVEGSPFENIWSLERLCHLVPFGIVFCSGGASNWQNGWSDAKKDWCSLATFLWNMFERKPFPNANVWTPRYESHNRPLKDFWLRHLATPWQVVKMQTEAVRSLPPALLTTASCRVFPRN